MWGWGLLGWVVSLLLFWGSWGFGAGLLLDSGWGWGVRGFNLNIDKQLPFISFFRGLGFRGSGLGFKAAKL